MTSNQTYYGAARGSSPRLTTYAGFDRPLTYADAVARDIEAREAEIDAAYDMARAAGLGCYSEG